MKPKTSTMLGMTKAVSNVLGVLGALFQTKEVHLNGSNTVDVSETLKRLIEHEDTDGDKRITIEDPTPPDAYRGERTFPVSTNKGHCEVSGTYYLSNLLQELKLLEEDGCATATLDFDKIFEPPVKRIRRMIREQYWSGLTRSIDEEGLPSILEDEKAETFDGMRHLYVPPTDKRALAFYRSIAQAHPDLRCRVVQLPTRITASYVRALDGHHGILTLALRETEPGTLMAEPFVVPGGRFNEMYGWDSYFTILGLLHDGKIALARSMVNNLLYEIEHYGKILNANRTYYLTRSQPPFLTSMILALYEQLPKDHSTKNWLARALRSAIREYDTVWTNPDRALPIGLSRYFDSGFGQPPEVEPGHFDAIYDRFAKQFSMNPDEFARAYNSRTLRVPELDEYFTHDRAMRESGHDTSYRLVGQCADLLTVDLNSLLYKTEIDIASIITHEFGGALKTTDGRLERSPVWEARAAFRQAQIQKYLWNEQRGMFSDYSIRERRQTGYVSASMFYPLWARLATAEQAYLLVKNALPLLEMAGGIAGSSEESRGPISRERPPRQWDFPYGWAPHQILIWEGLQNYGYTEEAERLAYRWLHTITSNAINYNGVVPEKYNVVTCSHHVSAEYGNVGTAFSYVNHEGFAWTNASYQIGVSLLKGNLIHELNQLASSTSSNPMLSRTL